jgi:hypothetical protein
VNFNVVASPRYNLRKSLERRERKMTTVPIPDQPGKFEVLFNGTALSCFHDIDCPGAGVCAINQTWQVTPGGWCMCFAKGGLKGDNCNELCDSGVSRSIILALVVAMSLMVSFIAIAALISRCKIATRIFRRDATVLNVILVSLTIGSAFMIVYSSITLVNTVGFSTFFDVIEVQGRTLRRNSQSQEYLSGISLMLATCFNVNVPLLLPLMWLDIASGAFKLKKRAVRAVEGLSCSFCCVVCFVQCPLYILAVSNYLGQLAYYGGIISIIWYVVYAFIILVNVWAATKVLIVKGDLRKRPETEANSRLLAFVNRVLIAAMALIIACAFTIGFIVGAQPRNVRLHTFVRTVRAPD